MEMPEAHFEQRCYEAIDRLLARYRWQLLDRATFFERTREAFPHNPSTSLQYLAFGVYNAALYAACSGAEGHRRREQGYTELYDLLCDRAHLVYPDVWDDAVQTAVEQCCQHLGRCAVPQAFFHFAWGYVQNAARSERLKRPSQRLLSLEYGAERSVGGAADSLLDPSADVLEQVLINERQAELRRVLETFIRENPRAKKQILAFVEKFLGGMSEDAISQQLGVSVAQVAVLRSRGKKQLQSDLQIRRLYHDDL